MVVGILLAIDIVIMLTWQFADPFYRDTKQIEPMVRFYNVLNLNEVSPSFFGNF